jgi:hypothetical protein
MEITSKVVSNRVGLRDSAYTNGAMESLMRENLSRDSDKGREK